MNLNILLIYITYNIFYLIILLLLIDTSGTYRNRESLIFFYMNFKYFHLLIIMISNIIYIIFIIMCYCNVQIHRHLYNLLTYKSNFNLYL